MMCPFQGRKCEGGMADKEGGGGGGGGGGGLMIYSITINADCLISCYVKYYGRAGSKYIK